MLRASTTSPDFRASLLLSTPQAQPCGTRKNVELLETSVCVYMCACIDSLCWCVHICVPVCKDVSSVNLCVHICECMFACSCAWCAHIYMSGCTRYVHVFCFCVSRCISTYVCAHVHLGVGMCLVIHICACMSVCSCAWYVHTCTHIYKRQKGICTLSERFEKNKQETAFILILMKVIFLFLKT